MKEGLRKLRNKSLAIMVSAVVLATSFTGCKDDDNNSAAVEGRGTKPAVMVSIISPNPDVRTTYVGAFSTVPSGSITNANMLEFGNAYMYAFDGSIFVWDRDGVTITRYEVSDDLKLTKGKTVSFVNFGFKYGADLTFISPTKAIMMVSEQNKVVFWDPSTMEVTNSFDAGIPAKVGFDSYPGQLGVSGNYMYYSVIYSDYNNLKVYPKAMFVAVPIDGSTTTVVFEDSRSLPGITGYVTSNGDIYVIGDADASGYANYSPDKDTYPPSGILRIKAGQTTTDQTYFRNLNQITGFKFIPGDLKIDNDNIMVRGWDPSVALPANYSDAWAGNQFISKKVTLSTGAVADFPAIGKGGFASNIQDFIDDVTYFPLPKADGTGDAAYRLSATSAEVAYSINGGGYWGMRKIR